MTDARDEIRRLLEAPQTFWPEDDYFHRRNREKLSRATTQLRKEHKGSLEGLPDRFQQLVEQRAAAGVGTIFVMSNGGAGCHHLGLLLSKLPGLRMTDEVYHPLELIESAEAAKAAGDGFAGAAIEALNLIHFGTTGPAAAKDWVVNIGHLRPEAKPSRLRLILPNARFVLLLRSPYEVATSRAFRKPEYRSASGADGVEDLDYLRRQARFTATFFSRAAAEEWDAIIRYEDIVREPTVAVTDLLTMIGLPAAPGAVRSAARQRSAGAPSDRSSADNLNVEARPPLTGAEATILAETLVDAAHQWGYSPPAEVADHFDAMVTDAGDGPEGPARILWTPLFSDIHRNQESYDRLLSGRVKVFRNLPVTDLPTGDDPWNADPLDNVSWRLFYHSLGWLLARSWAIENGLDVGENVAEIERVVVSHIAATVESTIGDEWAWDDHATGDRLAVIAYMLHHHLAGHSDRETRDRIVAAMEVHVERIADFHHQGQWLDSNHGVFQAMGAINVGIVLPDHPVGRRALEVGLEYLRSILGRLVHLEDGVSVEQSVAYHSINLALIRKVQQTVRANDISVGIDLSELCGSMVAFNHALRGSGHLPSIGDTPFGYDPPPAALEAREGETLGPGARFAISGGTDGAPFAAPLVFDQTGLVVLRQGEPTISGTVSRAVFVVHRRRIHHGHFDQLSVTHQVDDHNVLVDSGGPYAYGDQLRFGYFVAARAHNLVLIGDQNREGGARRLGAGADADGAVQWAVGEHDGVKTHRIRRAVALVDGETLVVFDRVDPTGSSGRHGFTTLWHLDPTAEPHIERADRKGLSVTLPHPTRPLRLEMTVKGAHATIQRGVEATADTAPQGWVTRELGSIEAAPVVVVENSGKAHHAATWIAPPEVSVTSPSSGRVVVTTRSNGRIELSYQGDETVVVRHRS